MVLNLFEFRLDSLKGFIQGKSNAEGNLGIKIFQKQFNLGITLNLKPLVDAVKNGPGAIAKEMVTNIKANTRFFQAGDEKFANEMIAKLAVPYPEPLPANASKEEKEKMLARYLARRREFHQVQIKIECMQNTGL